MQSGKGGAGTLTVSLPDQSSVYAIAINGGTNGGDLVIDSPTISASGDNCGVQVNEGSGLIKLRSGSLTAQAAYTAVKAANLVGADNTQITATVKTNGIEGEPEVTITADNVGEYEYIATGTIRSSD